MRLLLDEHFSPAIARELRASGHDVVAVKEQPGLVGLADRVQFAIAPKEKRAIVTKDVGDFRPLLQQAMERGDHTYGLVCVPYRVPLTKRAIGKIVQALTEILGSFPGDEDLRRKGGEVWLRA